MSHVSHVFTASVPPLDHVWIPGPARGPRAAQPVRPHRPVPDVWPNWTLRGDGWNNNLRIDGFMHLGFYEFLEANKHDGEICGFETSSNNI